MKDEKDKHPSDKRRRANIANARASTGPRTQAGKKRSANNALRHGLSAATKSFSTVEALAWGRAIAASLNDESETIVTLTSAVAAAQLEVVQVRRVRHIWKNKRLPRSLDRGQDEQFCSPSDILSQELRLDRYEQRAMSRRKRALRELESVLLRRQILTNE